MQFPEILLSKFPVLFSNLIRSLVFWSFEFASNFGFRASDLAAAVPHCALCASSELRRAGVRQLL